MGGFTYTSNLEAVVGIMNAQIEKKVYKACIYLTNKIKQTLTGIRHGKVYRVYGTGRTYVASAPGEAPAVRTGVLRNSIKYYFKGSGMQITGYVGSAIEYAVYLETGTKKMAARPYFWVTFEKERLNILRILGEGMG